MTGCVYRHRFRPAMVVTGFYDTTALTRKRMPDHSKLVRMKIWNLGCIGPEGLEIALDRIICLVGPNNAGKSTVLRAYELAVKNDKLDERDKSLRCPAGECPAVEIVVHIPAGTSNIDERWTWAEGELRLVKSRWEWPALGKAPVRSTWDPVDGRFADDGKAAGLDTVFSSRLPQPLRIGSLQDPKQEQESLLGMVLEPIAARLEKLQEEESTLKAALSDALAETRRVVSELSSEVSGVRSDVNQRYQRVFPGLQVDLRLDVGNKLFEPAAALKRNSLLQVTDAATATKWDQQGTGAQRALFWSLLAVRSKLAAALRLKRAEAEIQKEREKRLTAAQEKVKKAEAKLASATTPKAQKTAEEGLQKARLELDESSTLSVTDMSEPPLSLPGHMLLIDEPETALHPNAVRAARDYLYELAGDPGWQIMLSTHSPLFIDPAEDHTTIVRLERSAANPTPRTFRSDEMDFGGDDREKLKMLLKFDSGLAEMFFGGFPVVVEGDAEYAAFEEVFDPKSSTFALYEKPVVVRARGKDSILLLLRVLRHFKVPFAVLHDADSPRISNGNRHSGWGTNLEIAALVEDASKHVRVVHRVSVPDFERHHGLPAREGEKPWHMWSAVRTNQTAKDSVAKQLRDLIDPSSTSLTAAAFETWLVEAVRAWAATNAPGQVAFSFDAPIAA